MLWSLFSGGKDSIALAHYLSEKQELAGVVYLETGIRAPEQMDYVQDVCRKFDWPLMISHSLESYEVLVEKYGFPRPWNHKLYMNYLKGRPFSKLPLDLTYASGVRREESTRRFVNAEAFSKWEGRKITAPILNWTSEFTWHYIRHNNLPLSPCAEALHISGDCFCGAFANSEERTLLTSFYPKVMDRVKLLEKKHGGYWGIKSCKLRRTRYDSPLCADCQGGMLTEEEDAKAKTNVSVVIQQKGLKKE